MRIGVFSFFSGAGFLDLGLMDSGMELLMSCEKKPSFSRIHSHLCEISGHGQPAFGHTVSGIDHYLTPTGISELSTHMKRAHDDYDVIGFVGGPPCPDFSVAGKNKGRDGDNGSLSYDYIRMIIEHRPDFFVFENVKGLYRTKKHREFFEFLKEELISKGGYVVTEKLLNSLSFGVPQDRERIIMFGTLKGSEKWKDITDFGWDSHMVYDSKEVLSLHWPQRNHFSENGELEKPDGIIEELTVEHWFRKNDVDNHPNSIHYLKPRAKGDKYYRIEEGDSSKMSGKRLHRWRYSPTVAYGNNEVHLHPYRPRRLTVAEALSLQSLPMKYTYPGDISLTDMFKSIGNGVPYLMSKGIGLAIMNHLI